MSVYQSPVPDARALEAFIYIPPNPEMIQYLAGKAREVIACERKQPRSRNLPPSPPTTPPQEDAPQMDLPSLEEFIVNLCNKSNVQTPTLMTTLVYLARLKRKLPPVAKGLRCTVHRIFLAALILSAKNLNDSSPKNKHWAAYSSVSGFPGFGFSCTEVNLMEKQLLFLLDWDLNVDEEDLYFHFKPFLTKIKHDIAYHDNNQRRKEKKLRALERIDASQLANYYENSHYTIPKIEDDHYMDPTGAYHGNYGGVPTPPSSSEVPDLKRDTSRSQSPDSIVSDGMDHMQINPKYNHSHISTPSYEPIYSINDADIKIVDPSPLPKSTSHSHSDASLLFGEMEQVPDYTAKPAKKFKAGNFMTRLMGRQA